MVVALLSKSVAGTRTDASRRHRRRDGLILVGLATPATLLVLTLYLFPLLYVLTFSIPAEGSLVNSYLEIFAKPGIRKVVATTAVISLSTAGITVVFSYLIALGLVLLSDARRRLMFFCVLTPLWLSVLIRAFAWITLLRNNGVINTALIDLGLITDPLTLVRNSTGVVIGMVHYMLPFAVLTVYSSLRDLNPNMIRAARSLGASSGVTILRILLPLTRAGILNATLLVFILSLGFYVTPAILGGGKVVMVAEYISLMVTQSLDWKTATTLATALLAVVLTVAALLGRYADLGSIYRGKRR